MQATRLDYECRSTSDNRVTARLNWENSDTDVQTVGASWQVEYQIPRADGLIATLEARGYVDGESLPPRMDDLFRLFAKVGLELPTHAELADHDIDETADDPSTLRFPVPAAPLPIHKVA